MRLTDVAAEAEIQAPAIYYDFPGREDLIEEVMRAGIADMREHIIGVLDGLPAKSSALDRLLAAVEGHLRHASEISDYTTASIRNAGQTPQSIRRRQIREEERVTARSGASWSTISPEPEPCARSWTCISRRCWCSGR